MRQGRWGTTREIKDAADHKMAAFDALPPEARALLHYIPYGFHSPRALKIFNKEGIDGLRRAVTDAQLDCALKMFDRRERAEGDPLSKQGKMQR